MLHVIQASLLFWMSNNVLCDRGISFVLDVQSSSMRSRHLLCFGHPIMLHVIEASPLFWTFNYAPCDPGISFRLHVIHASPLFWISNHASCDPGISFVLDNYRIVVHVILESSLFGYPIYCMLSRHLLCFEYPIITIILDPC